MILNVIGIEFGYRSESTIKDITFSIDKGDVLTILGPNGVGKTTLLKCINRILKHRKGTIMLDDFSIETFSKNETAKKIGYVSQQYTPSNMSVFDAVLLGRKPHININTTQRDINITAKLIELLGLCELSLRRINEISGGEYQLMQIARALAQEPEIMILDEPTSSLDLKNRHIILNVIKDITEIKNMAAIMTVHDLNQAIRYSNKFIFMKKGMILATGGTEIITPELIEEVYEIPVMVEILKGFPMVIPLA